MNTKLFGDHFAKLTSKKIVAPNVSKLEAFFL